jgi:hypothetical protein
MAARYRNDDTNYSGRVPDHATNAVASLVNSCILRLLSAWVVSELDGSGRAKNRENCQIIDD